jgi:hypothetical protein
MHTFAVKLSKKHLALFYVSMKESCLSVKRDSFEYTVKKDRLQLLQAYLYFHFKPRGRLEFTSHTDKKRKLNCPHI